jgi:hypothetical protein
LAAQKFVSDIVSDAYKYNRTRHNTVKDSKKASKASISTSIHLGVEGSVDGRRLVGRFGRVRRARQQTSVLHLKEYSVLWSLDALASHAKETGLFFIRRLSGFFFEWAGHKEGVAVLIVFFDTAW